MTCRGANAGNAGRGSHWIRDEKRRRIYDRDDWRCIWCGRRVATLAAIEQEAQEGSLRPAAALACLDHVCPRSRGGSNEAGNLVTSCMGCNEARGEQAPLLWCYATLGPLDAPKALSRLIDAMGRELPPARAKAAAA